MRSRLLVLIPLLPAAAAASSPGAFSAQRPGVVVLTFDDAVRAHRTFVAPLLELGFSATFFITQRWMDDAENFMSWEEVAEIHGLGFEIGNHSWSHLNFGIPENAARLSEELGRVEEQLSRVGVPAGQFCLQRQCLWPPGRGGAGIRRLPSGPPGHAAGDRVRQG